MTRNPDKLSTGPNRINPPHQGKPGIVCAPGHLQLPACLLLNAPLCSAVPARPESVLSPENLRLTTRGDLCQGIFHGERLTPMTAYLQSTHLRIFEETAERTYRTIACDQALAVKHRTNFVRPVSPPGTTMFPVAPILSNLLMELKRTALIGRLTAWLAEGDRQLSAGNC
ncbi:hypothetical protein Bbelb_004350 [Branchiostoma belcheri]|nr:hypothetical protein Bbelb_004350 [Branchiostoma belcheri]